VREGIAADAIHGDKSQSERIQALEAFKQGKVMALIATDVAARGLDIDQLPMVINYEIPSAPEDYVHRIGRTGRAGALGEAISLVAPDEEKYLAEIEKLIKREIPKEKSGKSAYSRPLSKKSSSSADPWFDKPYEPSGAVAAPKLAKPIAKTGTPKREVAALLGGLPRK
jgi:superfamily II DNA/RNA helicase